MHKKRKEDSSEVIYPEETEGKQASNEYLEDVILPELEDFLAVESAMEIADFLRTRFIKNNHY